MDVSPSELRRIYWRLSFNDLKVKLKLSSGFQQVRFTQEFQVLAEIVSAAFGKQKPEEAEGLMIPKNAIEAEQMLKIVLGR
jgi:hypothetical protein